jgi:excinuclease ABC subunit A
MVDRVMAMEEGTRAYLLAPIVRDRKGEYRKEFLELRKQGFQRVKVNGEFHDLDSPPTLDKKFRHDIDVVVDRIVVREGTETRLADSFRTALDLADGIAILETAPKEGEGDPNASPSRKTSPARSPASPSPRSSRACSPSTPPSAPARPATAWGGAVLRRTPHGPRRRSVAGGRAIAPWRKGKSPYFLQTIQAIATHYGFDPKTKWKDLPEDVKQVFLRGSGETEIQFRYDEGGRVYQVKRTFEGVIPNMERRYRETDSAWIREEFERYQNNRPCGACGGYRLRPEALAVKIAGLHVGQVVQMSIREALAWCESVPARLSNQKNEIARAILKEIRERLGFLNNVGLEYLTLSRNAGTLSGGESQRIRLASQIGSGLTGVLYVLDEPSIGLHQRDNDRLLTTLKNLRDQGNTVIVVEHDEEAIREADYVFDIGPGAGVHGGQIVAQGTPPQIAADPASHHRPVPLRRPRDRGAHRTPQGQGQDADRRQGHRQQPEERHGRLPAWQVRLRHRRLGRRQVHADHRDAVQDRVHEAQRRPSDPRALRDDQGARTSRQGHRHRPAPHRPHPALEPRDLHRRLHPDPRLVRGLPEAKARGYKPGRFSFNVKGGRCEACQGDGVIKIEMHFLPDVYVTCETCKGKRYNRETLEVQFKGKSIADVLDMTVEDAQDFFKAVPSIREKMDALMRSGLGYIKVGQQATTLSGGEAQRVKLSKELSKRSTGRTLYILDEPTTGLHFEDVRKLLEVLHELVGPGQHGRRDRTQPRRHQDRRLADRHRPRGWRRRRSDRGDRHTRRRGGHRPLPHRPLPRPDAQARQTRRRIAPGPPPPAPGRIAAAGRRPCVRLRRFTPRDAPGSPRPPARIFILAENSGGSAERAGGSAPLQRSTRSAPSP